VRLVPRALAVALIVPLVIAGCGESDQAKAEKTVCEGKQQISTSVQSLQGLTLTTASIAMVQGDIKAIGEGLTKIKDAQSKLSGPRREKIEKANSELSAGLSGLTHELSSLTISSAETKLTAAVNKLVTSYKQALAPIEC
jgi:hypothetical protein